MTGHCYDGTFAGFLTLCAHLVTAEEEPGGIGTSDVATAGLFGDGHTIVTDEKRAGQMLAAIARRMGPESCRNLHLAFCSEAVGVELLLWRYLVVGRRLGTQTDQCMAHPDVGPVLHLARRTGREAHRLKGIVRFRETAGGYWYAPVEPACRVLELIAPHFADRFSDMNWLIHDRRRSLAVAWNGRELRSTAFSAEGVPPLSAGEERWSALWRSYFAGIAIPERANRRIQRQFLPRRFRNSLTELEETGH